MNKIEINDADLKNVNGGNKIVTDPKKYVLGAKVGQYKGIVGKNYFFRANDGDWIYGRLIDTYEKKTILWFTTRVHVVLILEAPEYYNETLELKGSDWEIFEVLNK